MGSQQTKLDWLLSRRLHIITGKGGVGKSTLCAAMGLVAARHGRRAIIVETDTKERMSQLFEIPPVGYQEVEIYPGLYAKNVDPDSSMEEYVLRFVRLQSVYDALFKKSFLQYWLQGMPGFREFVVLGKIWDMGQSFGKRHADYDMMIIDSPATGHGVSLWQLPESTRKTFGGVGPLANHAGRMRDFFGDPGHTAYHIATIPEELPYTETVELVSAMRGDLNLPLGFLLANQIPPAAYPGEAGPLFDKLQKGGAERDRLSDILGSAKLGDALVGAARSQQTKHGHGVHYIDKLAELDAPMVRLPFVYAKSYAKTAVEKLSQYLEAELQEPLR